MTGCVVFYPILGKFEGEPPNTLGEAYLFRNQNHVRIWANASHLADVWIAIPVEDGRIVGDDLKAIVRIAMMGQGV